MSEERKPGTWRTTLYVLIASLLLYPLSIGPACWLQHRGYLEGSDFLWTFYAPIRWAGSLHPILHHALDFWSQLIP